MSRYIARSASDRTDDWPFWFVADGSPTGLNVTNQLMRLAGSECGGAVFTNKPSAQALADWANSQSIDWRAGRAALQERE